MVEFAGALVGCRGCGYMFKPAGLADHVREAEVCAEKYEVEELAEKFGLILVGV